MRFEYIHQYYGVPADFGVRVEVESKPGIIVEDRGHYIGVNFDSDPPGIIKSAHPTNNVMYGGFGKIRKVSKSKARYRRFLEYGDSFPSFLDYCRWDQCSDRSWNGGSNECTLDT